MTTDADRERYAEQAKRQEEKRLAEHLSRVEKMDYIERLILPLTFKPLKEGASENAQLRREIMSGDESVGNIAWELSGYSYQHKSRYRLRSPRIPSRGRYGLRHGHRDYKNIDSRSSACL
jgi:L-arabinose isomerase